MEFLSYSPSDWYQNQGDAMKNLHQSWNMVPLLNVNEVKNGKLIRFRGMVQDMLGPELYLDKYEVINKHSKETSMKIAKYQDFLRFEEDESIKLKCFNVVKAERHTYVVIPIPSTNAWVRNIEIEKFKISDLLVDGESKSSVGPTIQGNDVNNSAEKYHLKVYENWDVLKLNDMFEFVGFLSSEPIYMHLDQDESDAMKIPRIHCIAFKALVHNNPLVDSHLLSQPSKMQLVRNNLMILLKQLLFGDELAAEYLLYYCISKICIRNESMTVGNLSLNISHIPTLENLDYCQELYKFLERLLTKSCYLPMTVDNLNELPLIPKKDYTTDRLTTGLLQLSPNTHIVLDETKLAPGTLRKSGLDAVDTITKAIKYQYVAYDFTYFVKEFDCDLPFLIISEGKSMLPSDCHVILRPDESDISTFSHIIEAAGFFLNPTVLNEIRSYITETKLIPHEITDSVKELLLDDYMGMKDKGLFTMDDLHGLLNLARLECVSQGKDSLDLDSWRKIVALDEKRRARN